MLVLYRYSTSSAQAGRRVPAEFVTQMTSIGNPPTILLVVERLLDTYSAVSDRDTCDDTDLACDASKTEAVLSFTTSLFPALHSWLTWFMSSQLVDPSLSRSIIPFPGGPNGVSFAWRGRTLDGKKLNPNTLASGLDDYPRAMLPSEQERHADLLSWMAKAASIMAKLEKQYHSTSMSSSLPPGALHGDISKLMTRAAVDASSRAEWDYKSLSAHLLNQLDRIHWSATDKAYLDVGAHDNNYQIVSEILIRCRNATDNTYVDIGTSTEGFRQKQVNCPKSHPDFMYPLKDAPDRLAVRDRVSTEQKSLSLSHVKHIGYAAIFPLLLQLLPPTSPKVVALLDVIGSKEHLWSPFGLRSLSTQDNFYRRDNAPGDAAYWRGPIWININFLALRALRYYSTAEGPGKERAGEMYSALRMNVLGAVHKEFEKSGDLW